MEDNIQGFCSFLRSLSLNQHSWINVSYSSAWAHGSRGLLVSISCQFKLVPQCWVFSMDWEFVSNMKTSSASFCVFLVHVWYLLLTMPTLHHQLHMVHLNQKYFTKSDKVLVVCYVLETSPFGVRFCQVKSAGVNPVSLMSYVRMACIVALDRHIFFLKILLIRLCSWILVIN